MIFRLSPSASTDARMACLLTALTEKNVLGYPTFSTITAYAKDETVFYDRRLYTFTEAHAHQTNHIGKNTIFY